MMCGCVHHSICASFPVCKEMQSLILPAKKAHRVLEIYIFMIVEDCARPSMLLSRQHANSHQIHAVVLYHMIQGTVIYILARMIQ